MRSKAPSGGMKEMVRSFSKRARRTHWWNLMSSRSTAFWRLLRPWASNSTCAGARAQVDAGAEGAG
jgi:hypothetical protein